MANFMVLTEMMKSGVIPKSPELIIAWIDGSELPEETKESLKGSIERQLQQQKQQEQMQQQQMAARQAQSGPPRGGPGQGGPPPQQQPQGGR
jgi:hypothetical protein